MNKVRHLLNQRRPLIAVSFYDGDSERLAAEAKASGVDIAELRIDQFSRTDIDHVLAHVQAFEDLPTLATVRASHEGGDWNGSEAERLELLRTVIPSVDAVDIEISSQEILGDVIDCARKNDTIVIGSYHNFSQTPALDAMKSIVDDARTAGADIVKVSTMAESSDDVKTLASLLLDAADDTDLIVIAMGAVGTISRVTFPALGSRLTYSFMGSRPTSGQLDFAETFHLMRRFYPDFNQRKIIDMQIFENV